MSDNPLSGKVSLDTTDFKTGISQINRELRLTESGFRASAASLGDWSKSADGLNQRIGALTDEIKLQQAKVSLLKDEYARVAKEKGENSRAAQNLLIRINKETEGLNKNQRELKESKEALDKVGDESEKTGKSADKMGKDFKGAERHTISLRGALGGLANVGKAAIIGVTGLAAGVVAATAMMATKVIKAFGELEQNLGGSEAVFGEYAKQIQKTGEEAYKNLGVSQSDYLATANKMGALFQGSGLDQVKALDLTERAMQRAADMASVMGIDTQTALDSVAGAAKGNFTMMDNLGVAMNATTVEAYALSKGLDFTWASATNAEKADVAMQMFFENTEQYAGNFAKESTQTITGSLGMLKAAVGSLMGGLGNADADIGNLTGNLVDAFQSVVSNIVPVLGNIVTVLPTAIAALLDGVVELLPTLLDAVTTLFSQVLTTVLDLLPTLIPIALDAIFTIVDTVIQNLPLILSVGMEMIFTLIDGILQLLPTLLTAAFEIILTLANGLIAALPTLIPAVFEILDKLIETLVANLPLIIAAALMLVVTLAQGIAEALPELIPAVVAIIPQIVITLLENIPLLLEAALALIMGLIDGMLAARDLLAPEVPKIIQTVVEVLIQSVPMLLIAAAEIIMALVAGIVENYPILIQAFVDSIAAIIETFKNTDWKSIGDEIVAGVKEGFLGKWEDFKASITEKFNGLVGGIKDLLGIASPSQLFAGIGENMAAGLGGGFTDQMDAVNQQIRSTVGDLESGLGFSGMQLAVQGAGAGAMQSGPVINVTVNKASGEIDEYRLARKIADQIRRNA